MLYRAAPCGRRAIIAAPASPCASFPVATRTTAAVSTARTASRIAAGTSGATRTTGTRAAGAAGPTSGTGAAGR